MEVKKSKAQMKFTASQKMNQKDEYLNTMKMKSKDEYFFYHMNVTHWL